MSKSLLFQIVKQILVNLVVHLFYVKEVVYHRGEQLFCIRKSLKLYKVLYRNTMKNIKISFNKIWYTYTALIQKKNMMLSLLNKIINANFDSNMLVEQMIKILGKDARFIVKCPYTCPLQQSSCSSINASMKCIAYI